MTNGIIILGLGPGNPGQLTTEGKDWINSLPEIYVRTSQHPTVAAFPPALIVHSFDEIYEKSKRFEDVYAEIVRQILEIGRVREVTYAVPGHPFVAEATAPEIVKRARREGIPVRVIEGLSFLEPTFSALEIDPYPSLALLDALELGMLHHPPFPPSQPLLIAQIYSREVASDVKLALNAIYPDDHPVRLVHAAGTVHQVVEDLELYEIDRSRKIGLLTSLYVPPLAKDSAFEDFQNVIARLRAPDGCPWDREQTHQSLRTHLLEETYETLAALDEGDTAHMAEEFGDLLLQIVLHAQIGVEEGEFSMTDILQRINRKIVRRHPHIFGDVQLDGVDGVLTNWEKLKAAERQENGEHEEKGLLDGVSKVLPALSQAQEYQYRVARVGFDWKDIQGVKAKILEELEEVNACRNDDELSAELGDLLFALVNFIRWYKIDAESALREANQRFRKRFRSMEKQAARMGRDLHGMSADELEAMWAEAKKMGME